MTDHPVPDLPAPFALTATLPPDRANRAATLLLRRETGGLREAAVPLVPAIGALLLSVPAGWPIGVTLSDAAIVGLCGYGCAAIVLVSLRWVLTRRTLRVLAGSALRLAPTPLVRDENGGAFAARTLPRSAVAATTRWQDCTLVRFSAADALALPDADLPSGIGPETLATRTATWTSR